MSLKIDVSAVPEDLLSAYVDGTFILVLNWWVDTQSPLSAREIDDLFLALVGPVIKAAGGG